jgi:hypothetical protein
VEESEEGDRSIDLVSVNETLAAADMGPGQDNFEESGFVEDGDANPSRVKDSEAKETNKTKDVEAEKTAEVAADD